MPPFAEPLFMRLRGALFPLWGFLAMPVGVLAENLAAQV